MAFVSKEVNADVDQGSRNRLNAKAIAGGADQSPRLASMQTSIRKHRGGAMRLNLRRFDFCRGQANEYLAAEAQKEMRNA